MKIIYVAWKQVICSDAQRIIYGIEAGKSNKGDQAIQNFNTLDENPGLWIGFTNGAVIPRKKEVERENQQNRTNNPTTFDIPLHNSRNRLKLWEDKNDTRKNPIKINQQIWDRNLNHAEDIIETWYVAYMRIMYKLVDRIIAKGVDDHGALALRSYIGKRLEQLPDNIEDVYDWVCDTQDGFARQRIETGRFLADRDIKDIKGFVEDYYYLVIKYIGDDGNEYNDAIIANVANQDLHPKIRNLILSGTEKKGGAKLDIDVAAATSDELTNRIIDKLYKDKNVILYGAPGTGKTRIMTLIEQALKNNVVYNCLDSEAPIKLVNDAANDFSIKWCTFHPDYSYEEFVWGLNPKVIDGKLGYSYHKGPFLEQVIEGKKGKKTILIIDEINRANTDDVFGDTIRLIDKKGRGQISITVPEQIGVEGNCMECGEDFYVIGTMNSLDKSVAPLSQELKRVFTIVEILPDEKALSKALLACKSIPKEFSHLVMDIYIKLNEELRENVGKEYMLGQGYLWDLVNNQEDYENTFADILRHKIIPHLKDVYPEERLMELFGIYNHGILYTQVEDICEICSVDELSNGKLIDAFAHICNDEYSYSDVEKKEYTSYEDYQNDKVKNIYDKLLKYKNIILEGPSGTGKSSMLESIKEDYDFEKSDVMYWHNSTGYEDVIEGISAVVDEEKNEIDYSYSKGAVMRLATYAKGIRSLMGIENIDKSNAGENFGELITLLEPDKRGAISIEGYTGKLELPEDMHFLATMSPLSMAQNKMDSALKRRFVILEMYPDYKLLSLWFEVEESNGKYTYAVDTKKDRLKLALEILKTLNQRISEVIGADAQLGHAVMWGLKETSDCSLNDIADIVDETILPMLEDYCADSDIAHKLLGQNTPLIKNRNYGVEIIKFSELNKNEWEDAFKELING